MKLITAPKRYEGLDSRVIFLAGGISGTPPWQDVAVAALRDTAFAVLNPRRDDFNVMDPAVAREQIAWEFKHLARATDILFWFPKETLCPITLYELGYWLATARQRLGNGPRLFVGCDPEYKRRFDVEVQVSLAFQWIKVHSSLSDLLAHVKTAA